MTTKTDFIQNSLEAPFVLQCTVKKIKASNIDTVIPDETTAILRVDEVFKSPAVLGNLRRKLITVKLTKGTVRLEQQFILTGRSWQYSSNIAIVEIERMTIKIQKDDFQLLLINAQLEFMDNRLAERVTSAKMIVSGKVSEVVMAKTKGVHKLEDVQENWFDAIILVNTFEKGKPGKVPEVIIRFPGTESEKWYGTYKFFKGQEGIWLLHEVEEKGKPIKKQKQTYLMAIDPLDFHLINQLDRIRLLIKRNQ